MNENVNPAVGRMGSSENLRVYPKRVHKHDALRAEVDRWRAEAEHRQEALTAVLAVVEAMRATLAEAEDAQATDAEWARQARTALWFVRQEEVVAFLARVSVLEAELRTAKGT